MAPAGRFGTGFCLSILISICWCNTIVAQTPEALDAPEEPNFVGERYDIYHFAYQYHLEEFGVFCGGLEVTFTGNLNEQVRVVVWRRGLSSKGTARVSRTISRAERTNLTGLLAECAAHVECRELIDAMSVGPNAQVYEVEYDADLLSPAEGPGDGTLSDFLVLQSGTVVLGIGEIYQEDLGFLANSILILVPNRE